MKTTTLEGIIGSPSGTMFRMDGSMYVKLDSYSHDGKCWDFSYHEFGDKSEVFGTKQCLDDEIEVFDVDDMIAMVDALKSHVWDVERNIIEIEPSNMDAKHLLDMAKEFLANKDYGSCTRFVSMALKDLGLSFHINKYGPYYGNDLWSLFIGDYANRKTYTEHDAEFEGQKSALVRAIEILESLL